MMLLSWPALWINTFLNQCHCQAKQQYDTFIFKVVRQWYCCYSESVDEQTDVVVGFNPCDEPHGAVRVSKTNHTCFLFFTIIPKKLSVKFLLY